MATYHLTSEVNTAGSPFDQIARTDAEGNTYWSARDLMPLMGYTAWHNFMVAVSRARKTAENTGMTCAFNDVVNRVIAGAGYTERKDVHLDRMAAYLVAMNGDPNKPEVAAAQAYFAVQTRRAELGETTPTMESDADTVDRISEITEAVDTVASLKAELSAAVERIHRLEQGIAVAAGVKPATATRPKRRDTMTLSQWRKAYLPRMQRGHLFGLLLNVGAIRVVGTRGGNRNTYRVTELGARHGLKTSRRSVDVARGREQDLKDFIESLHL